ncbi:hypothetical protein HK098_000534 [Nowakowskiella sp. JEL0407]|nr:hypothetical protein HK098_000534 [Nowakowskiella sp. JEL0407]
MQQQSDESRRPEKQFSLATIVRKKNSNENLKLSEKDLITATAPEGASSVMKFKSAANEASFSQVDGSSNAKKASQEDWRPPVQRHVTKDGQVQYVTIRVRIFAGDEMHDFNSKFAPGLLTSHAVFDVIANRENISKEGRKLFGLWIIGRDLELQLRPKLNLFDFIPKWHKWVEKYTHYPEAANSMHPINRHWIVFKRAALLSKHVERKITDEVVIKLLYGEAKHNVIIGRYPCTAQDAVTLAALQLQSSHGDIDQRHQPGFITKNNSLNQYIPSQLTKLMRPEEWEGLILKEYAKYKGKTTPIARMLYLQYVRQWSYYGTSFFPICKDVPPGGFFEFRTVQLLLGVGAEGLVIVDVDKHKLIFEVLWEKSSWVFSKDTFLIKYQSLSGKEHSMRLISPQSPIINNVSVRATHLIKKMETELENQRNLQRGNTTRSNKRESRQHSLQPPTVSNRISTPQNSQIKQTPGQAIENDAASIREDNEDNETDDFEIPQPAQFKTSKINSIAPELKNAFSKDNTTNNTTSIRRQSDIPLPFDMAIASKFIDDKTMNINNLLPMDLSASFPALNFEDPTTSDDNKNKDELENINNEYLPTPTQNIQNPPEDEESDQIKPTLDALNQLSRQTSAYGSNITPVSISASIKASPSISASPSIQARGSEQSKRVSNADSDRISEKESSGNDGNITETSPASLAELGKRRTVKKKTLSARHSIQPSAKE